MSSSVDLKQVITADGEMRTPGSWAQGISCSTAGVIDIVFVVAGRLIPAKSIEAGDMADQWVHECKKVLIRVRDGFGSLIKTFGIVFPCSLERIDEVISEAVRHAECEAINSSVAQYDVYVPGVPGPARVIDTGKGLVDLSHSLPEPVIEHVQQAILFGFLPPEIEGDTVFLPDGVDAVLSQSPFHEPGDIAVS
ncbi:hypothetical protein A3709_20845 [Halioglobus sp. HI00S01]|uniref:hypothetical protein n=1 Tax=Halioglobus sp. HI00S01 TaxID=1822214 RepID=UPI0007C253C4|nr:hypothetical protein [Halioglobus sp. HI00S01]KZX58063.1 hypothetical protein A3709_20845 [Halioglobus sp. HI00S01]